jgi:chromosome condensin MukBEF complex kleisin-like MukF subunit
MSDDLRNNSNIVKRLRNKSNVFYEMSWPVLYDSENLLDTAAERIEELEAKLEKAVTALKFYRIEELETKLAQAVESLEKLARLGNGDLYGNSDGNMIARAALAELKGKE